MNPLAKLAAFFVGLIAVFSGGLVLGNAIGSGDDDRAPARSPAPVQGFGQDHQGRHP